MSKCIPYNSKDTILQNCKARCVVYISSYEICNPPGLEEEKLSQGEHFLHMLWTKLFSLVNHHLESAMMHVSVLHHLQHYLGKACSCEAYLSNFKG